MDTQTPQDPQPALKPEEAAAFIGISKGFLAQLRMRGEGPKFCRVSGTVVRYLRSDIIAWLESRRHSGTTRARSSRQ